MGEKSVYKDMESSVGKNLREAFALACS